MDFHNKLTFATKVRLQRDPWPQHLFHRTTGLEETMGEGTRGIRELARQIHVTRQEEGIR